MKLGIVGLPNVGKSTLFNAITEAGAEAANYPFCTIEPNVGVVKVPDERVDVLGKLNKSKKVTHTSIEFFDIAGLVKGASKGEGLGNKFLSHIREVEAIVHVVRCFKNDDIVHVDGSINPIRDIETINLELIFSDIEVLERRADKLKKQAKGDKTAVKELELVEKCLSVLNEGKSIRSLDFSSEELETVKEFNLLSNKPIIYVANVSEEDILKDNEYIIKLKEYADKEGSEIIKISAEIESEIASLDEEEKKDYLKEMGLEASGLERLIKSSYKLLGLISFLTTGEDESRAWTIKAGTTAQKAAGKIHSDIERGFIRAEVISYEKLMEYNGSTVEAKDRGAVRIEGKEYIMQDGDVVHFRFNV
ncbi:MAG: redox-regulated ATPase YchF [Tissierellia bacterium]|nr:redox-regulated ATPase YchF [Tissierellia bacterium]